MRTSLEDALSDKFSTLQTKIYQAQTLPIRYEMSESDKRFLILLSVLSIYASWEGFFKDSLSIYLQDLNMMRLTYDQLSDSYLAHQTDEVCEFKKTIANFDTIKSISVKIRSQLTENVVFNVKSISVSSNLNLKIANSVLRRFSLAELDEGKYKNNLDRLIFFRNRVAHGDESIPISFDELSRFSTLIQDLAVDVIGSILTGYEKKVYANTQNRH